MNRYGNTSGWGGVTSPIGVVAEVAPGQYVTIKLHGHMHIELAVDTESVVDNHMVHHLSSGPTEAHIVIDGYISDWEPTTRPEWATEPAGEIEAPVPAIEAP